MKSAFECFQHAAKCEEQAKQATSKAGRSMLIEAAKHWRTLGNTSPERPMSRIRREKLQGES